jgi:parvulin-like peptidyl-prolyl isomerase
MDARKRGRTIHAVILALAALGVLKGTETSAQLLTKRNQKPAAAEPSKDQAPPASFRQSEIPSPTLKLDKIPVNPGDAIAIVNGEAITRAQLADECVARRGQEILETLVNRKLIEQAMRARKLDVTAAEIDQEIDNVAQNVGHISREAWLRTLDKERGISPVQYARDIIYPALALRKLASPRVQVTGQDMKDSFEAMYGDKLRCRIIMVDKLATAQAIWEELRKNPGGFQKLAQERSMDSGSRSLGGLLGEPITRHAHPRNVSDTAFHQLVDGDPEDKDPTHKPKDGDFTGPIQVAEATWIIIRREEVIPAQKIDPKNEAVRKNVYEMIYEVKLKEKMNEFMVELIQRAAIDNKLTGHTKLANENLEHQRLADGNVKLMSNAEDGVPPKPGTAVPQPSAKAKLPTPAAASPDVVKQVESLQKAPVTK